ncbi:hypothetical protein ElyMa_001372200 [Elysia marginata]|uniref:Uncharacterized protein n=1 Tax=Elysia marginata TaxID=1093978 RepID=A0AAV4IPH1_9GAST|nr:hypothetical protein ElyMa_001372200 [Elysia marginata]
MGLRPTSIHIPDSGFDETNKSIFLPPGSDQSISQKKRLFEGAVRLNGKPARLQDFTPGAGGAQRLGQCVPIQCWFAPAIFQWFQYGLVVCASDILVVLARCGGLCQRYSSGGRIGTNIKNSKVKDIWMTLAAGRGGTCFRGADAESWTLSPVWSRGLRQSQAEPGLAGWDALSHCVELEDIVGAIETSINNNADLYRDVLQLLKKKQQKL